MVYQQWLIYNIYCWYAMFISYQILFITHIKYIYMICKHFVDNILKRARALFCTWFQVLLCNSHNLTPIICLHTVCSIWPIERTLSGATTPGQSSPGSNGNEGALHIPQRFKAESSLSWFNVIFRTLVVGIIPLYRNAVSLFLSLSWPGSNISSLLSGYFISLTLRHILISHLV